MSVTIEQQLACVRREIAMRERVYPRWVEQGKMKPESAKRELDSMRAVLETLQGIGQDSEKPSWP